MKLKRTDKLEVIDHSLRVNGKPFRIKHPAEPVACMEDGKLVTLVFRGCGCTLSHWEPEEIEGDFCT